MKNSDCYIFIGLAGVYMSLMGALLWIDINKPNSPEISIDSIGLQNINISSDHVTADWDFNFLIKNSNDFGFSYLFTASLYYDKTYKLRNLARAETFLADSNSPTFSQGGKNQTTFTVRFERVSVPIDDKLISKNESGENSEFSGAHLGLNLEGDIEPAPKTSLSPIMRRAVCPLYVKFSEVKVGISSDSATGVATHVYYGKDSHRLSLDSVIYKLGNLFSNKCRRLSAM